MEGVSNRKFYLILTIILAIQFLAGLWHISYPFVDGRVLYNWGPPFWLIQAQDINEVGLNATYWGVKDYPNHPQLIGPVISIWTKIAGYSEASIRILTLSLTVIATGILALAIRLFIGIKKALAFTTIFASIPLIYIYGRKLDQEALVLLFLAIHLLGIAYINNNNSEKKGYVLVMIGGLGMALSDWSGIVFTGIIGFSTFLLWKWKDNKKRIIKFFIFSYGACLLGLIIFLIQSYLQSGSPEISVFFNKYYDLWKYRAGISQSALWSWGEWIQRQFIFISKNYSIWLFISSLIGLGIILKSKASLLNKDLKILTTLATSIFISELIYIVLLPQASGIHIYFQYFFSIPVAIGLLTLLDIPEKLLKTQKSNLWFFTLLLILILNVSFSTYEFHNLLFKSSGGDISDIELIKSLKSIPKNKEVIVAGIDQLDISWYQNPNIIYYSERDLKGYLLEEGVPFSDYQLVPKSQTEQYVLQINNGGYGKNTSASSTNCSLNICLVSLKKN